MKRSTRLIHLGRPERTGQGPRTVNHPVVRASTVLFDSTAQMADARRRRDTERLFTYGVRGTPTAFALEDVIADLEGGFGAKLYPSGQAAVAGAMLAFLKPGDHVLVTDSVYQPVRRLFARHLEARGIQVDYYRPDGSDIPDLIRPETRLIHAESPGSFTMEMQDIRALADIAHDAGALLSVDNTWASGWAFQPLAHGADLSILAATKYVSGHSDVMMGTVTTTEAHYQTLHDSWLTLGTVVSADDCALALRGVRTLPIRFDAHGRHAMAVANHLAARPEIAAVLYPPRDGDAGHALFTRDFTAAAGLMTVAFQPDIPRARVEAMVDALDLFGIGASWGGFESLALICDLSNRRPDADIRPGTHLRLHIGLEDPDDLIADLDAAMLALGG